MPDGYLPLPPHADHWLKVRSLRWDGDGRSGFGELEPLDSRRTSPDSQVALRSGDIPELTVILGWWWRPVWC